MNYYKQGDAANAEQIKAAFEAKGFIPRIAPMYYGSENVLFFTGIGNYIYETTTPWVMNIIKTHPDYKELELTVKPKFKVGDWVVRKDGTTFCSGNYAEQITIIEVDGKWLSSTSRVCDDVIRLWTIQDAKDGDVLVTTKIRNCPFIYRRTGYNDDLAYYYAGVDGNGDFCEGCLKRTLYHFGPVANVAPATKEQRDLLFSKMKEAGYQWDADKKELKKIQPHYDIANFKPFDKVLVRCDNDEEWKIEFFCIYDTLVHTAPHRNYPFMGIGDSYSQCIPFNEDTKHLLGITDPCDDRFINW